jgi:hypothetical protein
MILYNDKFNLGKILQGARVRLLTGHSRRLVDDSGGRGYSEVTPGIESF